MRTIKTTTRTYDSERGTTLYESTETLYTFGELPDDARARVVSEYAANRANDPIAWQEFSDFCEAEIWDCVHTLAEQINVTCVKWEYSRFCSCGYDCTYRYSCDYCPASMEPVVDNGLCYSYDLCEAWNAHMRTLNGITSYYEYVESLYYDTLYAPEYHTLNERLDDLRSLLWSKWYEELDKACSNVRNTIEFLLRSEWEWFTGKECAEDECIERQGGVYRYRRNDGRVLYSDSRKWYTIAGEFADESAIYNECVSIVPAAHYNHTLAA